MYLLAICQVMRIQASSLASFCSLWSPEDNTTTFSPCSILTATSAFCISVAGLNLEFFTLQNALKGGPLQLLRGGGEKQFVACLCYKTHQLVQDIQQ